MGGSKDSTTVLSKDCSLFYVEDLIPDLNPATVVAIATTNSLGSWELYEASIHSFTEVGDCRIRDGDEDMSSCDAQTTMYRTRRLCDRINVHFTTSETPTERSANRNNVTPVIVRLALEKSRYWFTSTEYHPWTTRWKTLVKLMAFAFNIWRNTYSMSLSYWNLKKSWSCLIFSTCNISFVDWRRSLRGWPRFWRIYLSIHGARFDRRNYKFHMRATSCCPTTRDYSNHKFLIMYMYVW